ncbi:polyamine aminopropyltransferase [Undibacterium sp. Ji49W]|uniref:polyamine aminopropyltransferase n=1 Tax=Undibacterium sp. Ji49W TaxID=3413040 RepID=UPI003BEF6779
MEGLHLTADCFNCEAAPEYFVSPESLRLCLSDITIAAGLTIVGEKFHPFTHEDGSPAGVTGALLLAESHVAIHTWPERHAVTLDVYVCNFNHDNDSKARQIVDALIAVFKPRTVSRQELQRGELASDPTTGLATGLTFEALSDHSFAATRINQVLARHTSAMQDIEIADTSDFGKVMRLDGAMMTSEKDEFFYHECLVHPAAIAHPEPRTALIIGGGDGGSCEELLKHPSITSITLCEIDADVVTMARQHLGNIHRGALDDSKIQHRHEDGFAYVGSCSDVYDLILLDLTDPVSPTGNSLAATCMTEEFFQICARRLTTEGMLVLHLGSPFYHPERFSTTLAKLQTAFAQIHPYTVFIPLYGALWGMAIASKQLNPQTIPASTVNQRIKHRGLPLLKYYNADVHQALFALPNYVKDLMPAT